jgi:nucleotide-binding universal stress UspA family protein
MGIGLTALPLHVGRRPVATTASATHGVGLVCIPALGAVRVDERLHDAAVDLVSGLLGEGAGDGQDDGRYERLRTRSVELAAGLPAGAAKQHGSLRFIQLAVSNASIYADTERSLIERVAHLSANLESEGTLHSGRPADVLIALSETVDILVIGSRGYGPLKAVLLGGVSGQVIRSAACPVIVVPRQATSAVGSVFAAAA